MDNEGVDTGTEGGFLQPPTMLQLAGIGRHSSVYYRAAPPRRSGALRQSRSRYRAPLIPEGNEHPSYPIESGDCEQRVVLKVDVTALSVAVDGVPIRPLKSVSLSVIIFVSGAACVGKPIAGVVVESTAVLLQQFASSAITRQQ